MNKPDSIKKDKSSVMIRYIGYAMSVVAFFVFCFFIYGQFIKKVPNLFGGHGAVYDNVWTRDRIDGVFESFKLPYTTNSDGSDYITMSTILPRDIKDDTFLCFLTRDDLIITIDGEDRLVFDEEDNPIAGGYVKSHYLLLELTPEDSGKTIYMSRPIDDSADYSFNKIYIGDKIGIVNLLMEQDGIQFAASVFLLLISIMIMIIGYILLIVYRRKMPIILLTYGTVLASLWFITDSFLYQIFFGNYLVDGPMEYMLIMLFPYFFGRYLNYQQGRRYEKIYTGLSIYLLLAFIIITALHFTSMRAFDENIIFTSLGVLICIIVFVVTIIIDIVKKRVKDYIFVAIGFGFVLWFGVLQIIILGTMNDNHNALHLLGGVFLLLTCGVINMVVKLRHLENQAKMEKQANALKSNFLANMSHEIRTPVNAMMGMDEMILRESTEDDIKGYAANIKNAGETLLALINEILDFSKIEAGKMELVESEYELGTLLFNINNIISVRAYDKDLHFSIEVDKKLPAKLYGDISRIQQVLINLLNNAVKYTKEGSVTFAINVNEKASTELGEAGKKVFHFEIRDTGMGIRPEDLDKLFDSFQRIDLKNNRSIEGTGLGLSIAKTLVELMGGNISVSSEYGKGSVFTVEIPQTVCGDGELGEPEKYLKSSTRDEMIPRKVFTAPTAKILVVDDVQMNINVIRGLVKRLKIPVVGVLSGKECMENYSPDEYDLILLDHMMPDMDGIETLKELKKAYGNRLCPVVVLTANAIEGMKEMYLKEGFDDYLSKPTKPEDLENVIRKYISSKKIMMEE